MNWKSLIVICLLVLFTATFAHGYDLKWRSSITVSPVSPAAGDAVTFTCRLKSGDGPSDNVDIELHIDSVFVSTVRVAHLNTDELRMISLTWTAVAGTHTVEMIIDPRDAIGGENQDNNTRSTSITVSSGSGGPPPAAELDLRWQGGLTVTPDPPTPGTLLTLTARVESVGAAAENVLVHFNVDGSRVGQTTIARIAGGASEEVSFTWTAVLGAHSADIIIDPLNAITETNERNNTLTEGGTIEEARTPILPGDEETTEEGRTPILPFDLRWIGPIIKINSERMGRAVHFRGTFDTFNGSLPAVRMVLRIDGIQVDETTITGIEPDDPRTTTLRSYPEWGSHTAVIELIQQPHTHDEENTRNNSVTIPFTTTAPARAPELPSFTPANTALIRPTRSMLGIDEKACLRNQRMKSADLTVSSFRVNDVPGDDMMKRLIINVRNKGMLCIRSFRLDVTDKTGLLVYRETASPRAGKSYALTGKGFRTFRINVDRRILRNLINCRSVGSPGITCSQMTATADPQNDISESREDNNSKGPVTIIWYQ